MIIRSKSISSRVGGLICISSLLSALLLHAQTPAFPGALGFGASATGGRNGSVYHVTNLNDSGAGSFRTGVSSGNRVIVFDVGGHITLSSAISAQGNITIAGQTAPGGISFDAGEISFAGRANVVCRYIRVRPGSATASTGDDCISLYQATNVILDHCSLEFGPWNNIDAVTANNISVQHCVDANPIYQQFGAHTENVGASWAWQYNIFANSHNRNPLAKINTVFINNLEYNNSAGYTTHTSTHFKHDIVNNYFIAGPASGGNFPWYQIDNNQSMYFTGNLYDSDKNGTLGGSATVPLPGYQGGGTILSAPWSSWTTIIPTMSTALGYRYDMSTAGAFPRDDVDSLVVSQIKTLGSGTTGTGAGTVGPDGSLYTSQSQTGLSNNGYGSITGGTAPVNFSGDGIADYWKLANNLSTNISYPLTNTSSGYTLLENYLNFLAAPHSVTRTNTPVDISLSQFTSGFSASSTFSLTNATNGTVTLLNSTNAHFVPTANFSGLGSFNFTVTDSGLSLSVAVTVCVTPVAPPASAAQFFGAIITAATNSMAITSSPPSNLTWRGDGAANVWDTSVSNWLNGSALSKYKDSDVVTFDNTGSTTPPVNLTATVSPGTFIFDSTSNYTIAGGGSLSGSMNMSKSGSGSLTLLTGDGFTGGTTINEGTLVLSNTTAVGSGAITLNGGALSLIAAGGPATYNNPVVVAAPSTVIAPSNQRLSGAITGSGNLNVNATGGTLSIGASFSGYSGNVLMTGSGTFRWYGGTGSGTATFDLGSNGATMFPRDGGTITLGSLAGGANTFLKGAASSPPATIYIIGGKNLNTTFAGTIANGLFGTTNTSVSVIKTGTGTFILTGTSTHTNTTSVTNGTLVVNGTLAASPTVASTAGTLTGTGSIGGLVTINTGGKFSPGNSGPGTFTLGGGLTLNGGTVNFDLANVTTIGNGVNDLISLTGGALTFTGTTTINPSFVGGPFADGTYTLITGGTSTSGSTANLAWGGPSGTRQTIALDTGTTGALKLNVSGTPSASLVWRGTNGANWDTSTVNWANGSSPDVYYNLDAVTFDDSGANPGSVTLTTTLTPASIVVNSSQNYTFNGAAITGGGALTKLGTSTLTIADTNSAYTGAINVFGGTLILGSGGSIGSGPMTLSNNAAFSLPSSGQAVFFGGNITVAVNSSGTLTAGGLAHGISGTLYSGNSSSILNIVSGVSFGGTTSAQFDNFTGTIHILSGGTLRYSPDSTGNTFGSISSVMQVDGLLQPRDAGNTVQIGSLTGGGTLAGPQSNAGNGDTLYVIGGNNSDSTFSGNISSNSAVASSDVIVNKIGTGKLTLNGASTYAGGTTVSAGTLRVNNSTNSATGSGDMEIFSGATLTGSGIIGSSTTIDNGATLEPGDPTGTLTISNNLTLNDNSILQFGLGTSSDSVTVSGDLFLTGQLNVTNSGGFGPGTYTLFRCGGALTFDQLTLVSAPSGYIYSWDTNTTGVVKLVVALLPPPGFGSISLSGTNLVFTGSGGTSNGTFYVLSSTNMSLPLTNWTRLLTNQFDASGNFGITNPVDSSLLQSFYLLQVP
jgi:autotransporter-associated beta strand protein